MRESKDITKRTSILSAYEGKEIPDKVAKIYIRSLIGKGNLEELKSIEHLNLITGENIDGFITIARDYRNNAIKEYLESYKSKILKIKTPHASSIPEGFKAVKPVVPNWEAAGYMIDDGSEWFAQTCFRGISSEIQKLVKYAEKNNIHCSGIDENGNDICEVWIYDLDKSVHLVEKFPQLKAAGLVEGAGSNVYAWFSDSGHSAYSEYKEVGYYDAYADGGDGRWAGERNMFDTFQLSFTYVSTGNQLGVNYNFPFKKQWEKNNYWAEINGVLYKKIMNI